VTRALRARLSYASYKATHNIPHVPLRELEAQSQSHTGSFARSVGQKRKVGGSNNYYNNPATQGNTGTVNLGGPRRGAMAPPSVSASASRSYYPNVTPVPLPPNNRSGGNATTSQGTAQSLYSSILAPPPAKQARTIHNAGDPPLPAPSRPNATPKAPKAPAPSSVRRSIAEGTRAQARSRKDSSTTIDRRKNKRADKGKQKERITPQSLLADTDRDLKAAATLTSLLLQSQSQGHSRGSGSAESPRSSISNVSDAGSFSHFVQSSTRTATAPPSAEGSFTMPPNRSSTPPGTRPGGDPNTTPKAAPTDTEAADLMLFLATSPSPARPTTNRDRDTKDMAAYRALGGGGSGLTGRVLFPGVDGSGSSKLTGHGHALRRGADGSYGSSISSIGSGMGAARGSPPEDSSAHDSRPDDGPDPLITHLKSTVTPPTPPVLSPSHLLPPLPSSPSTNKHSNMNPSSSSQPPSNPWPSAPGSPFLTSDPKSTPQASPTPNSLPFNFNDFINVSPSPAHVERGGPGSKSNLGLRADVGRKLFEEEQQRQVDAGRRPSGPLGLGAGIDLVQS
jgi:hypothetical protein